MSAEVEKSDRKLAAYLEAARQKLAKLPADEPFDIDQTQKLWLSYRSAHCGDVYEYWSEGSYRYRASLDCMLDLTRERTHDIWSAYLTFADSTPALLPEP